MQKLGWLSKSWSNEHKWSIASGTVLIAGVIGIIALLYQWSGSGFGPDSTKSIERNPAGQITKTIEVEQSGKTLWDWLSVVGVPLSLVVLGFWLQQREKEIAAANQREEALQAYFDRLSTLLIDKNLIAVAAKVKKASETEAAQPDSAIDEQKELLDAAVDVIRARTLSILRQFEGDGERKSSVIRFLIEVEAIEKLNLSLRDANLSHIDLSGANLSFANLSFANLSSADFSLANLEGTKLSLANLSDTKLNLANLNFANLSGVNLRFADLSDAALSGVNLRFANLEGANLEGANLSNTDLSFAKNWTEKQLSSARLCKTQLPEGCDLDPNQDCKKPKKPKS